jgi:hypothetical protein
LVVCDDAGASGSTAGSSLRRVRRTGRATRLLGGRKPERSSESRPHAPDSATTVAAIAQAKQHLADLFSDDGNSVIALYVQWLLTMKRVCANWGVAAVAFLVLLTACAEADTNAAAGNSKKSETVAPSNEPVEPGDLKAPPPVTVRFFNQSIDLHAWTYCYANGCADGSPPSKPPDIGDPDAVVVEFPLSGWSFKASFSPAGEQCGRVQTVPLVATGEGDFVLRPAGHADTYDVTLIGRGDGDLFTTFRWTTPLDGPLPEPRARLAVLADHDGTVDSYGVELEVRNLARTPRHATAMITVQARNGDAVMFRAKQARGRCFPEGTVYWDGPDDKGLAAAGLGGRPFTYKVELKLDGVRYVAIATWPDDEIAGNEPSVSLDFTPDLPAVS